MAESIDKVGAAEAVPSPLTPFSEEELLEKWAGAPEPVVSIVCWTYNHAPFIRAALDGILGQDTDFPFEVLVRDDASNDGTADIVREYAARYPRVVRAVLEPTNTYSRGIKPPTVLLPLARGKFVAVCEGDDYWTDGNKLAKQVMALRANPHTTICFHDVSVVRDGRIVSPGNLISDAFRTIRPKQMQPPIFGFPQPVSWVYRRSATSPLEREFAFIRNGDALLLSQLARAGGAVQVEGRMAVYRLHEGGIYSGIDDRARRLQSINSYLWIANYHFRTGGGWVGRRALLAAIYLCGAELRGYGRSVAFWYVAMLVRTVFVRTLLPNARLRRLLKIP